MKKLLIFISFSCLFTAWELQKPIHNNLQSKKSDYQKTSNHDNWGFWASPEQKTAARHLSQKLNLQHTTSSAISEVADGEGTDVVGKKTSKNPNAANLFVSSFSESVSAKETVRPNLKPADNTLITNMPYGARTASGELEILIPIGASLPAAIVDPANNLSAPQVEVLDAIAEEFLDSAMATANSSNSLNSPKTLQSKWSQSLNGANERYRSLYGVDAYNAWTSHAAKEALNDHP